MSMDKNQLASLKNNPHYFTLSNAQRFAVQNSPSITRNAQKETVKLSTGEYVLKSAYDSLSPEDRAMLSKKGLGGYQGWLNKTRGTELSTGEFIPTETFNKLSEEDKKILSDKGLKAFSGLVESRSIKLSTGEYISKEDYDTMSPEDQKVLMEKGYAGLSTEISIEEVAPLTVTLDTGETVNKSYYDNLLPAGIAKYQYGEIGFYPVRVIPGIENSPIAREKLKKEGLLAYLANSLSTVNEDIYSISRERGRATVTKGSSNLLLDYNKFPRLVRDRENSVLLEWLNQEAKSLEESIEQVKEYKIAEAKRKNYEASLGAKFTADYMYSPTMKVTDLGVDSSQSKKFSKLRKSASASNSSLRSRLSASSLR